MIHRRIAPLLGLSTAFAGAALPGQAPAAPQPPPPQQAQPQEPQQPPPNARQQALERAMQELGDEPAKPQGDTTAPPTQAAGQLRLTDVSLDIAGAAGASTGRDRVLRDLQGGGHDPKRRGFTFEQAELSVGGAVDPFFTAQSHIVFALDAETGDSAVELEEAFVTSQALPGNLQLRAGTFLTEFGRMNPSHPHAWDWQDQPMVMTRVFGGDGMRGPGARLSWLLPTPNYTELYATLQNANGPQMTSFLANEAVYAERPIGGRAFAAQQVRTFSDLVGSARLVTGWDLGEASSAAIGASVAYGPNPTGDGAQTLIYGADAVYKWRAPSSDHGWPFFTLQGEYVARAFEAGDQVDARDPLNPVAVPGGTLRDHGGYLQAVWGFARGWDVGLRGEWAGGSGSSYDAATRSFARASDPFRADRWRVSPLLAWQVTEFSRFRLQYDYDDTEALPHRVHSLWLGFEMLIGKHPPHDY